MVFKYSSNYREVLGHLNSPSLSRALGSFHGVSKSIYVTASGGTVGDLIHSSISAVQG